MSTPKLTPWFDGSVKPVRRGVYQRKFLASEYLSYWNGRKWCYACSTEGEAARDRRVSLYQTLPWRGLAEEPKQ